MTKSHLALRGLLVLLAGLPLASRAGDPLIVVEDRGGTSALPYYEALNLQPRADVPARPPIPTPQVPATPADEAAMLPVRSTKLTPGTVARRDTNVDDGSTAILRFQVPEGRDQSQVVNQVEGAINNAVGQVNYSGVSVVGSKVSGELFTSGLLALGVAIGLMFLYIWFRFEPQFGFGAVVGLLHDVILTFGLIVLFKLEFSLNMVAAVLTVIGYSMNDTVVVFDRLRENLRKYKTMPLRDVIDLSLNETLSRTIITGVTAVMVLAALALFGGEALFGFSVALMFGIIIGTYSSIYVGAPIILLWGVKRGALADDAKPVKLGMASRP